MGSPTLLVTGSDGLIGRYVVRMLSESHSVIAASRQGLTFQRKNVRSVNINLQNAHEVERLIDIQPDVIIHLAAALPFGANDISAITTNKSIDLNIFNLAKAVNAGVVFCSSVSVYGGQSEPWVEYFQLNPESSYALEKLRSEELFSNLSSGAMSLRISSPYGATHPFRKGVLYHFARESLAGRRLTIYDGGGRTQDFVHALDVARAVYRVVESWGKFTGLRSRGVLNIASGEPVSMLELGLLTLKLTGNSNPLVCMDAAEGEEHYRSHVSIAKAASTINWKPLIDLNCGLAHFLRTLEDKNEDWFAVRCAR
jgi:nucleoside-diphosphate-sugar epimerase